jgi:hypothetical protein
MRYLVSVLLVLLFVVQTVPLGAAVLGVSGSGMSIAPHEPLDSEPPYRSWFTYRTHPGATIEDSVDVTNVTSGEDAKDIQFLLYADDTSLTKDDGMSINGFGYPNRFVGKWIQLDRMRFILPPSSMKVVPFTISLPDDLPEGKYWGAIAIDELIDKGDSTSTTFNYRLGVRVFLDIKNGQETEIIDKMKVPKFKPYAAVNYVFDVEKDGDLFPAMTAAELDVTYFDNLKEETFIYLDNNGTVISSYILYIGMFISFITFLYAVKIYRS